MYYTSINNRLNVSFYATFLGVVGEFVAHHVYGDECQQHRGEGNKEAQVFGHRLLDVSNTQKHNSGIQVNQPVEPEHDEDKYHTQSFISTDKEFHGGWFYMFNPNLAPSFAEKNRKEL